MVRRTSRVRRGEGAVVVTVAEEGPSSWRVTEGSGASGPATETVVEQGGLCSGWRVERGVGAVRETSRRGTCGGGDVGTLAGKLAFASSVTEHAVERQPNKLVRDVAFFVVPRAVNDIFIGGTKVLVTREKYILESLNDLSFIIVDEGTKGIAEASLK